MSFYDNYYFIVTCKMVVCYLVAVLYGMMKQGKANKKDARGNGRQS